MNKLRIALFVLVAATLALAAWAGSTHPLVTIAVVLLVLVNDRQLSRLEERVENGGNEYTDEDQRRDYVADMSLEIMRNATSNGLREYARSAEQEAEELARRVFDKVKP
jgi:hypothetical protein